MSPPKRSGPRDLMIAAALAAGSLGVYLRTLTHGLLVDDSAEFQTMARLFGHTHPTGYEVYTLLTGVAARVFVGDVATRVTAFSAVAGAATVAAVYLIIRQLGARRLAAAGGAILLAVGPTFWSQAVIAEVYTLGLVLAAAVIGSLARWGSVRDPRWLAAAGLAGGISLGVHFTNGLLVPAIGLFLWVARASLRDLRWAASGALAGVLVAVGAFLIIDAVDPPSQYFDAVVAPSASSWDYESSDIDGAFERLRFDWTARQFQSQMFSDPATLMPERWGDFRGGISSEVGLVGLAVSLIGLVQLARRRREMAVLLAVSLVMILVYAFNYEIGDLVYVFYLPAYLILAILFGVGLGTVPDRAAPAIPLIALLAVAPVAWPNGSSLVSGETPEFAFESYPTESGTDKFAVAVVEELPPDAVVFTDWDLLYTYVYVANVERGRSDLAFHETKPADDSEDLAESLFDYAWSLVEDGRPVYISDYESDFREAGFSLSPVRVGPARFFVLSEEP